MGASQLQSYTPQPPPPPPLPHSTQRLARTPSFHTPHPEKQKSKVPTLQLLNLLLFLLLFVFLSLSVYYVYLQYVHGTCPSAPSSRGGRSGGAQERPGRAREGASRTEHAQSKASTVSSPRNPYFLWLGCLWANLESHAEQLPLSSRPRLLGGVLSAEWCAEHPKIDFHPPPASFATQA